MRFSILAALMLQCVFYVRSQDTDGMYVIGGPGCPRLNIDNGVVEPGLGYDEESYLTFTEVTFRCDAGYLTVGETTSRCLENGRWSNTESPCKGNLGCPRLMIDNGVVEPVLGYDEETYSLFAEVTFRCDAGYLKVGETTSRCLENGRWSNTESPCKAGCLAPKIKGGITTPELMSEEDYYRAGEVVLFKCSGGLVLKGSVSSTCQEGGSWTEVIPGCFEPEPIGCQPPSVRNGFLVTRLPPGQKIFRVDDQVFVKCNDGYVRDGRAFLTCKKDGSWDDGYSACKVMKPKTGCGAPNFPARYGVYMPPMTGGSYPMGTKLTFKCNQGRVMHGSQYSYCQANGQWNAFPDCVLGCRRQNINYGTTLPAPNVEKEYYKFGQTVTLKCNVGYRIVGVKSATCSNDGIWSHLLLCSDVCDKPIVPNMKTYPPTIGGKNLYKAGQNITCKCNKGYKLHGPAKIQCMRGGKYNVEIPSCKRIYCDAPSAYSLATYRPVSEKYEFSKRIRWVCKAGYVIKGAKYSFCSQDGTFKPAKPICTVATDVKEKQTPGIYIFTKQACFRPRVPINGYLKPKKLYYDLASEVEYGCKTGYIMSGTARSTCRTRGFGTETPKCTRIKCVEPRKIMNGRFASPVKKTYYFGDKVRYACAENHIMYGSAVSTCQANAQFSPNPPSCKPPSCRFECTYVKERSCQCHTACRIENNCCKDFDQFCRKLFY